MSVEAGVRRHVVLGTADPWIRERLAALAKYLPLVELRLGWGYAAKRLPSEDAVARSFVSVRLPPRSLGRLRLPFRPVVRRRIMAACGGIPSSLWLVYPVHWPVAEAFPEAKLVYIAADDYRWYGWPEDVVERYERALVRRADLVVAVSRALAERLNELGAASSRTVVSPNGLPAEWIPPEPPEQPERLTAEVGTLGRPVVGVIGRIGRRLRLDWLETAVRNLPDIRWLFVGPVSDEPSVRAWQVRMSELPDCRFVGPRPYCELRDFHAAVDVTVLPYADGAFNACASPVRLFSSLPFRAPIVATPGCRQVEEWTPYVHLCRTQEEFADTIASLAREGRDPSWPERHALARFHTWEERARQVVDAAVELGIVSERTIAHEFSDAPA